MSPRTPAQFEEIREEKKRLIMNTALDLFANEGYHTTSISKIAQHAGISKGLLYNYFKSKEDLLESIIYDIMDKVMDMLNPNHDNVIEDHEAENFFNKFFKVLTENPKEWKLFYQLSVQKDVMDFLMTENMGSKMLKNQQLILNYFKACNFKDPEMAILLFSSVFKGFTFMYVFAPEMFSKELVEKFVEKLKHLFVHQIEKGEGKPIELDERLGYFLL